MRFDPAALTVQAEAALAKIKNDPIAAFRFSSNQQRMFVQALSKFRETLLRSGNQAGKTYIGAFCGVAIARGCTELDGVALPILGAPNNGVVLAKGRDMAKESVIRAYRQAVGNWPHHLEKNGNNIAALWVKPNRSKSDEWQEWSSIRFFVEDGQSVEGMRLDWVHADEPPMWKLWEGLRTRSKANRHFVRFITMTPLDKREWKPVREDFRGCAWPEGKGGKVELTMSVFDNKALGAEHLKALEEDTRGPLQRAKLYGEYVDTTGSCPFDADGLKRWRERCIEPLETHQWTLTNGRMVEWETWGVPVEGEQYLVVADPSAGIEDEGGEHDPCEVVVVSRGVKGRPAVLARYNGYIPAYELGRLSTHLATAYNRALLIFERNSGYGEAFFLGIGRYGNLYIEHHLDSRHLPLSERVGWTTTATSRGAVIGALQKAVLEDGLLVLSEKAVDSLENVVVKRDGLRIEAGAGSHDEDMIVLGIACHILGTSPLYVTPEPKSSERLVKELGLRFRRMPDYEPDPFMGV
jgi:hypothetical protein